MLTKQQREIIVCALASKDAEESSKLPPEDMEEKPFPTYLQFIFRDLVICLGMALGGASGLLV